MAAAACFYHGLTSRPCVSLRDFFARPTPLLARRSSRAGTAVLDRSAELRAAGSDEAVPARELPPLPAAAAGGVADLLHWSPVQREQTTHNILHAFLAVEGSNIGSSGGSSGTTSSSHSHARPRQGRRPRPHGGSATAAADSARPRGLQGRVVEHLLGGGFDEALLGAVPTHTLNWVIKVLGEQRQMVLAEQLYHWMRVTGRANQHSFVKFCEACGATQQPWRAFHAWRTTRRVPQARHLVGSHAGAALILAYRSTADHRGALAALQDLQQRGVALDRYAYNAAIRVCADAGEAEEALRVLGLLRAAAAAQRQRQGHVPPPAQQQQGQLPAQQGQQQQQQQQQQRQEPGQQQQGQQQRHSAPPSATAASQATPSGGLHTDCRTYSAALAAVAATGKWARAAQLHRWLDEDGVPLDAPLCTQLLACYAAAGQAGAAQQLFDSMEQGAGPRPNRSHWNALLLSYAESRDGVGCAATYRCLLASGHRPDGYTLVALLRAAYLTEAGLPAVRAVQAEAKLFGVPLSLQLGTALLACLRHVAPVSAGRGAAALAALRQQGRGGDNGSEQAGDGQQQQRHHHHSYQPHAVLGAAASSEESQHSPAPAAAAAPVLAGAVAAVAAAAAKGVLPAPAAAGPASPAGIAAAAAAQQQQHRDEEEDSEEAAGHAAACLAEAVAVFAALRRGTARKGRQLDVRVYNALLAVQLAAGDHAGVLNTFQQLEGEPGVLPDGATLAAAIAACRAAGWKDREAQYRTLLHSSRLLGSLGEQPQRGSAKRQPGGT